MRCQKMPLRPFEKLVSPSPLCPFIENVSCPSSEEAEQTWREVNAKQILTPSRVKLRMQHVARM
jgi:hypothetical protein